MGQAVQLNALATGESWKGYTKVKVPVDSCAEECVCGPEDFPAVEVDNSEDRKEYGREYACADDGRIFNVGEKKVPSLTDEGSKLNVKWQVTQVNKPLLAVSKLADAGFDCSFNQSGGYICNRKTGTRIKMHRERGLYFINMWVPKAKAAPSDGCFTRPR